MSVACWELKAWVLAWVLTCSRFVVLDCFISQKQSIFLFSFSKDTMAWAFISQVAQFLFSVEKNNSESGNKANRRVACPSDVTQGPRPTRDGHGILFSTLPTTGSRSRHVNLEASVLQRYK